MIQCFSLKMILFYNLQHNVTVIFQNKFPKITEIFKRKEEYFVLQNLSFDQDMSIIYVLMKIF